MSHETDLSRRKEVREPRLTVLVVTNGRRTERDYFNGLRAEPWVTATLRVSFVSEAPASLVARAAALRDANDYDAVWAVCDVDEFDIMPAIEDARTREVGLALSNPCFEVWLILHKSARCPGLNSADQAQKALRKHVPSWDKHRLEFADFRQHVFDAVERAKSLGEPPDANPSTAVWRVVEWLRSPDSSVP